MKTSTRFPVAALLALAISHLPARSEPAPTTSPVRAPAATDWPQWRGGPAKSGTAAAGPKLITTLPAGAESPKVLWRQPALGGWTDAIIAQGRVIDTNMRAFSEAAAWRIVPNRVFNPGAYAAGPRLGKPPFYQAEYQGFQRHVSITVAQKLHRIVGRRFETAKEFHDWCGANGLDAAEVEKELFMLKPSRCEDIVVCRDPATGNELWRRTFPGMLFPGMYNVYSTAAVADGRVYFAAYRLYCLDLDTGRTIWQSEPTREEGTANPLVHDGIVMLNQQAWDARTGKELWKRNGTFDNCAPSVWAHDGTWHAIAFSPTRLPKTTDGGTRLTCVEPRTGRIMWAPEDGLARPAWPTPAISGDYIVLTSGPGVGNAWGYRLAIDKPTKLWEIQRIVTGPTSPVVHDGRAYILANYSERQGGPLCVDLVSGKLIWRGDIPDRGNHVASPFNSLVLADNKLFVTEAVGEGSVGYGVCKNGKLHVVDASSGTYKHLFSWPLATTAYPTPSISDGRLYAKVTNGSKWELVCFDLRSR